MGISSDSLAHFSSLSLSKLQKSFRKSGFVLARQQRSLIHLNCTNLTFQKALDSLLQNTDNLEATLNAIMRAALVNWAQVCSYGILIQISTKMVGAKTLS